MLEKNKNCIEFSMHTMMLTHKPYQEDTAIAITGMISGRENLTEPNPFDIPCDVVMVPKKEFERLQTENEHYRELAKQREHNYELLLTMTGFNTLEELTDYIHDAGKNSKGCWKTLKEIADDAEKDYIFERDKAEVFQTENEQLKNKLEEFSPVPEYLVSVNGWEESAKFWKKRYDDIFKLVGFSSKEEVEDYLVNEAEADTLHEAILKLTDQVKYTCDEWYSTNSRNNSWEKEIIDLKTKNTEYACKIQDLIVEKCRRKTVIEAYKREIEKWQKATDCKSPDEAKEEIANLKRGAEGWENDYDELELDYRHLLALTGFDTEVEIEDFLEQNNDRNKLTTVIDNLKLENEAMKAALRASNLDMLKELDQEIDKWQKATGCNSPEEAETTMRNLRSKIDEIKEFAAIASNWTDRIVED